MGAFFLCRNQNGAAVDAAMLPRAMSALVGFAPFGFDTPSIEASRLVVARERGHSGFAIAGADFVVFDGALSARCRRDLPQILDCAPDSDAVLAHAAFKRWGERAAKYLEGRFVLIVVDRGRDVVWLLRDALGERGLHMRVAGATIYAATRASALLAAANLSMEENPHAIAAYFGLRAPAPGEGFWQGVRALQAGECLYFDGRRLRSSVQSFDVSSHTHTFTSDRAAVDAWQDVLHGACARTLADAEHPAILLSGGIDSSALAASASVARPDLVACSWQLPEFPSADEAAFIAATVAKLGLRAQSIVGQEDWPLARLDAWQIEDEAPIINPYHLLHQRVYLQAAKHGTDVLISGNFGDHLYPDTAAQSGWVKTARQLLRAVLQQRTPWGLAKLRSILRRYPPLPDWLQPSWSGQLQRDYVDAPHSVLSAEAMQEAELGRRFTAAVGIELRFPYRDAEVIRFMTALPTHFFTRESTAKWITREAMRGRLPENVRVRPKSGSLEPYFRHGILDTERNTVDSLLRDGAARWPKYVKAECLFTALENSGSEADLLLIWLTLSYELWWRAHSDMGPAVLTSRRLDLDAIGTSQ